MKKPKGFEQFILQQALDHYKNLVAQDEYSPNSFITKEFVLTVISDLQGQFGDK